MPATRAVTGNTWKFYIGSVASPLGYTQLLEVKTINGKYVSVPNVNAGHLLSPNATEEMLPGMIQPGKLSVGGNFVGDATQLSVAALAQGQTVIAWKVEGPVDKGTKTYTAVGTGFISDYGIGSVEQNKTVDYAVEVQMAGTFTESVA